MSKVIVVVGPTSSGKSSLGVELAKKYNGEIINGDAISVYKELNIGSAKITEEEMQGVKHHLIDYLDVKEEYNVAQFQQSARAAIEDIISQEKLPIVVGGTGLYVKALLYDYDFSNPTERNDEQYEEYKNEQLYEMLVKMDEKAAEKVHPNNRRRVIRALQICNTGTKKSEIEDAQMHQPIYDCLIIGLNTDREVINQRINNRVDQMVEQGLENEVKDLFEKYPYTYHCFQGIGYKEFIDYVENRTTLSETIEAIKLHTRQFAKRQMTWFKNQMDVTWFDIADEDYKQQIEQKVEDFING